MNLREILDVKDRLVLEGVVQAVVQCTGADLDEAQTAAVKRAIAQCRREWEQQHLPTFFGYEWVGKTYGDSPQVPD